MADFKIIETQEDFDERIKERLERAERKVRDEFKGWLSPEQVKADLEKVQASHNSEIDTLNSAHAKELKKYEDYDEKFKKLETENNTLKVDALKHKVAMEKKLPLEAFEFLQGEDEETITLSADRLLKLSSANHSIAFTKSTERDEGDAIEKGFRDLANSLTKK